MNVFLSGKIDAKSGAWRNEILGFDSGDACRWRRQVPDVPWAEEEAPWEPWGVRPGIVLGRHDYVGPFREDVAHGSRAYHLPPKAYGVFHEAVVGGQHGVPESDEACAQVVRRCQQAIRAADIVFAYINSADAYGTLVEIGYAVALGRFVGVLVQPDCGFDYSDFWFAEYAAQWRGSGTDVVGALKDTFVAYAAMPLPEKVPVPAGSVAVAECASSLAQIQAWTSDPRVRQEAARMLARIASRR